MAIYQDTYYSQNLVFEDSNGNPVNISGWTFTAHFRVNVGDANPPLLTLTTANGGFTVVDAPNGKLSMVITQVQTSLLPVGNVVTDLMRTDQVGASPARYAGITFKVKQPVTRL